MFSTNSAIAFTSLRLATSPSTQALNIDDLWGSLKDKAEVMLPPQDMVYQMREFGIKDPNGYALIPGEDISEK